MNPLNDVIKKTIEAGGFKVEYCTDCKKLIKGEVIQDDELNPYHMTCIKRYEVEAQEYYEVMQQVITG